MSISPNAGSAGGELLTVTGSGFGMDVAGLNLSSPTLGTLCAEVTPLGYGSFTCKTVNGAIATAEGLSLVIDGQNYSCGNPDTTACEYEAVTGNSPTVSNVSASGATLTFTGL